jgi:hypothetical protein
MVGARRREAWDHTSWLCAVIANHAFGVKRARKPADFNPMRLGERAPIRKLDAQRSLDLIRKVFKPTKGR